MTLSSMDIITAVVHVSCVGFGGGGGISVWYITLEGV